MNRKRTPRTWAVAVIVALCLPGFAYAGNVVCVPTPRFLTAPPGDAETVTVDYLGGASGPLYGFSIAFTWDPAIAATSVFSVTEGTLLSDEGLTWFEVHETGADTITVDCVLLGAQPGVTGPGTMFAIEFTGVAYGETPVHLMIVNVRDNENHDLTGFVAEDGLLVVNGNAPVVTNVLVTDASIGSTIWVKDGDAIEITATVNDADHGDGDVVTVTANLNGLHGGAGHEAVPPTSGAYPNYTWTIPSGTAVCAPANGTVTVEVNAVDAVGNAGAGADEITSDNTPPSEVTDLLVSPHFHRVGLEWSPPSDAWGVLQGIEIHRTRWGDYPEYAPPEPAYPDTPGESEPDYVGFVAVPGLAFSDNFPNDFANRDIYYYTVWAVDRAGNASAAGTGAKGRAVNYWLADFDAPGGGYDGYVDFQDINRLSAGYRLFTPGSPPPPPFNELDIAPTWDGSKTGIPYPDNHVNFEELMLTALSFNDLTPTGKTGPVRLPSPDEAGPPMLALAIPGGGAGTDREVAVTLRLKGNDGRLKGASIRIEFDARRLEWLGTELHPAWEGAGMLFFASGLEERGAVWVDFAALGASMTIEGNGDIAVLRFRAAAGGIGDLRVTAADLRDMENEPMAVDIDAARRGTDAGATATTRLGVASPNPFNPSTTVRFELRRPGHVRLQLFDAQGRLVRTLTDASRPAGPGEAVWDGRDSSGRDVASGVYFVRMEAGDFRQTGKLLLVR